MKSWKNNSTKALSTVILSPIKRPVSYLVFLCFISLAASYWSNISLNSKFWMAWLVCLIANFLALRALDILKETLIPTPNNPLTREILLKASLAWLFTLSAYIANARAHHEQVVTLEKILDIAQEASLMIAASTAATALTWTSFTCLLLSPVTALCKQHFKKRKA